MQKEIRNLIKEIAEEENMSFEAARELVFSQFKYLATVFDAGNKIDKDTYKNVVLRRLGTFHYSEKKFDFLKNKAEENENTGMDL